MRIVLLTLGRHGKRGKERFSSRFGLGLVPDPATKVHTSREPTPQLLVATYAKFSRAHACVMYDCLGAPQAIVQERIVR